MNRSLSIKLIAFVQIIVLMVCTVAYGNIGGLAQEVTTTTRKTLEDVLDKNDMSYVQELQDQRADLQHQANELEDSRRFYSDTLEGLLQRKDSIEKQIALKQQEIDINARILESVIEQINSTDEKLIAAEQEMLLKRQSFMVRFEELRGKLRDLSKGGRMTPVQMVLSTDSYMSFLINMKMASRIATADQEILSGLEQEMNEIQAERESLLQQQQQLEAVRQPHADATKELQVAKEKLITLHEESLKVEDLLSKNLDYFQTQYMQIINEQRKLHLQLSEVLDDYDMSGVVAPSIMQWPTPDCTFITSSYKIRWGKWHYGLDIASWGDSTGKPIYAAADGTVIFAGSDDSGYGNYLIVDHGYDITGKRVVTLYGHCHELLVKEGDVVFGGVTKIATVGDTGRSSGAHLHFEVRVDGGAFDPIANGYLLTDGITIID